MGEEAERRREATSGRLQAGCVAAVGGGGGGSCRLDPPAGDLVSRFMALQAFHDTRRAWGSLTGAQLHQLGLQRRALGRHASQVGWVR